MFININWLSHSPDLLIHCKLCGLSIILTPVDFNFFKLDLVELCVNISKSIAGAINTGHFDDKKTESNKLSQLPKAILEIVFAVTGAIIKKSAHNAKST